MLGELQCTRAGRVYVQIHFWIQTPSSFVWDAQFQAVGIWGKHSWLRPTEWLVWHRVHPWCNVFLGCFQGCLHNNDILLFTRSFGYSCGVLPLLAACPWCGIRAVMQLPQTAAGSLQHYFEIHFLNEFPVVCFFYDHWKCACKWQQAAAHASSPIFW